MNNKIYLDNAATTRVSGEVYEAMLPYFREQYYNPSAIYQVASANKDVIEVQKEIIAGTIGAKATEIYFTGSGSESDNWALIAVFEAYGHKGNHIITSKIEHPAILETCKYLEKRGARITYIDVDSEGQVDIASLQNAIDKDTILISIMHANNEIGSIQNIKEIGEIAQENDVFFHVDAVQTYGKLSINVDDYHIDMLSLSAHKINGPKGIGALYIRGGVKLLSFIHGGHQERGRRAGTENMPAIVGFGTAARIACEDIKEKQEKIRKNSEYFIEKMTNSIEGVYLNGDRNNRLANNVNLRFDGIDAQVMLISLDFSGILASSGSACATGSLDASHVLLAIGLNEMEAKSSIRFTLGEETTREEIDYVIEECKKIIERFKK